MKAIIRVLVVPRLTGIDITEDGLQDWPSRLTDEASFQLWIKTSAGCRSPPTDQSRSAARAPRSGLASSAATPGSN